jgi:hypothetical protein
MLAIQIAVPRELLDKEEDHIEAFLLAALREAVDIATHTFLRAKIPFDEAEHLALVERVARASLH